MDASLRDHPTGYGLLHNPRLNMGTAFTMAERQAWGLEGLLPPAVTGVELQVARRHAEIANLDNDLLKYLVLSDLQARNETLLYTVLMSDPATYMPLVYTHGRDGYCSIAGPDCGDDQKISDRVGQRTSHCLFGSVPRRRGQSAASSLKSSGIGISGPYCCIKRSVCNFPWRGHIRQAISISAVRAATAPSRIEPLDALTSAPRTRGQARD